MNTPDDALCARASLSLLHPTHKRADELGTSTNRQKTYRSRGVCCLWRLSLAACGNVARARARCRAYRVRAICCQPASARASANTTGYTRPRSRACSSRALAMTRRGKHACLATGPRDAGHAHRAIRDVYYLYMCEMCVHHRAAAAAATVVVGTKIYDCRPLSLSLSLLLSHATKAAHRTK